MLSRWEREGGLEEVEMRRVCRKYLFVFLAGHTWGERKTERVEGGGVGGEQRDERRQKKEEEAEPRVVKGGTEKEG